MSEPIFRYGGLVARCLVLVAAIATLVASGGGGGGGAEIYPLWVPTDILVRDVDGDGRSDVLALAQLATSGSQRGGRLTVHRQLASGAFTAPESYDVGTYPWRMALDDIDGDGAPDLVIADVDAHAAWVLFQDGGNRGHFLAPEQVAGNVSAYDAAIADLDGDGAPDIAVTDGTSGAARLLLLYQEPALPGTFRPAVDFPMPGAATYVAPGDVAGDAATDLLAWVYTAPSGTTPNGSLATVVQAGGALDPASTVAPQAGLIASRIAIADYDGDTRNDLFAFFTPSSTSYAAKLTVVLQGPAPGSFQAPTDTSLAGVLEIDDAVFADLNADGRPDAAVAGFYPVGSPSTVESKLSLYLQDGAGGFSPAATYRMPVSVSRVAAGDMDGDGRQDLVVLGGDNEVFELIQSHVTPGEFAAPARLP